MKITFHCYVIKYYQTQWTDNRMPYKRDTDNRGSTVIDNNFGNLCMKKGGSFQKERFSFFSVVNGGGVDPRNPPRAYATDYYHFRAMISSQNCSVVVSAF